MRGPQGKTPLAEKLDEFGAQLSVIIGWVCLGVWAVNAPRFASPAFGVGMQGKLRGAIHYLKAHTPFLHVSLFFPSLRSLFFC